MKSEPNLTDSLVVRQLTEACELQLNAIREAMKVHGGIFGPLNECRDQESDASLRLRKVFCHTVTITSCAVDRFAIHAMAPDIRAALAQLKILFRDEICAELHEPGDLSCTRPSCFSTLDGLLAPFTHPTTVLLSFYQSGGGLMRDDARSLRALCVLLYGLSFCYSSVLNIAALRIGRQSEDHLLNVVNQANPGEYLELADRFLSTQNES